MMVRLLPRRIADGLLRARLGARPRPGEPRGVLLIASGGLGDTALLAHVAERFLALAREGEPVTLLLRADAAKTAFLLPERFAIETVDFARLRRDARYRRRVLGDLHRRNLRLVVSLDYLRHPALDEALVRFAAAPEAFAMEPRPWPKHARALRANRRLYTRLFASGPVLRDKIERWAAFAGWLTGRTLPPPRARLAAERIRALVPEDRDAPSEPPLAVIQPFSALAGKELRPVLVRAILDVLPADCRVLLTGGPGDLDRHPGHRALLEDPRVRFDARPFAELASVLRGARLVISADTALMHVAIALGARTLGLASAAYVGEIVPYAESVRPANARFLYHDMPCRGCLGDCRLPAEDGVFPCVARLDTGRVLALVRDGFATAAGDWPAEP